MKKMNLEVFLSDSNSQQVVRDPTEGEKLVMDLQDSKTTFEDKIKQSQLRIFSSSQLIKADQITEEIVEEADGRRRRRAVFSNEIDEAELGDTDDEGEMDSGDEGVPQMNGSDDEEGDRLSFADSDSDLGLEEDDGPGTEWKSNLHETARAAFAKGRKVNLMDLVYGSDHQEEEIMKEEEESESEEGGLFKVRREKKTIIKGLSSIDTVKVEADVNALQAWEDEEVCI